MVATTEVDALFLKVKHCTTRVRRRVDRATRNPPLEVMNLPGEGQAFWLGRLWVWRRLSGGFRCALPTQRRGQAALFLKLRCALRRVSRNQVA